MLSLINLFFFIFLFFFSNYVLIKISKYISLVDVPNDRKIHIKPTPLIGGILIYFILLTFYNFEFYIYEYVSIILFPSSIIVILGALDDKFDLDYKFRILVQLLTILIIIISGLYINSLGSYFKIEISDLGIYGIILTFLSVLILTNAINFIDGIDGFASIQIIISILTLVLFSFFLGNFYLDKFIIYLLISLFLFLIFNLGLFHKFKIFLGDSGSNFLGFLLAWIIIYYSSPLNNFIHPVLAIWTITYPLFDFLSVIFKRLLIKQNPFFPDMNHFHHFVFNLTDSKYTTLFILIIFSLLLNILGGALFYFFGSGITFLAFIIFFILYFFFTKIIVYK